MEGFEQSQWHLTAHATNGKIELKIDILRNREKRNVLTAEHLRAVCRATPFRPFSLHLADGREISVQHPEFIFSLPSGRTIIVTQPDDAMNIIDVQLVTDVEFKSAAQGAAGNGATS
jgi:hypothetical protein